MRINKIIISSFIVATLLASCKKNENNGPVEGLGFKAQTEHKDDGSRTYLDGINVKWMEDDAIKVANTNGDQQVFPIVSGDSTMFADFYDANVVASFYAPDYVALYPATNANDVENTIDGNGIAEFHLPSTQTITATGTFANKAMPMVAHSSNQTLPFKNVLGGLIIPLVGDGLHVTSLVLTSLETTDKLWGDFTADCNSDDPVPTYKANSGGNHQLTLACDVTLDAETPNDFIFMVPPGTLSKGFKVEMFDGTTKLDEKTADWSATPEAGFIPRSVLRKVSTSLQVVVTPPAELVVTTISPTFISTNSAYGKGTVSGGTPVECGLCWKLGTGRPENDVPEVTIDNDYTITATAGETFAITFTDGLVKDNVYWVRAWARNAAGNIYYGDPIPFATRKDYANDYNGRLPYQFSVSSTKKVYFSMGNLQWSNNNGATHATATGTAPGTWRFAEYQFEYVGDATIGNVFANGEHADASLNGAKSDNTQKMQSDYNGWIDLFCWGTSGYQFNSYQTKYQPWQQDGTTWDQLTYQGYGPIKRSGNTYYASYDLTGTAARCDWGVFNAISNGGNTPGQWRLLKGPTWNGGTQEDGENQYLFRYRTVTYARWARIQMTVRNDQYVHGDILFPDTYALPWEFSYTQPGGIITDVNYMYHTEATMINEAEWSLLEYQGAVLWPAAGLLKTGSGGVLTLQVVSGVNDGVDGWTSTRYRSENTGNENIVPNGARRSYTCNYNPGSVPWFHGAALRNNGNSVRLVQDAN